MGVQLQRDIVETATAVGQFVDAEIITADMQAALQHEDAVLECLVG